jgi:NTE family protein
MNTYKYLVFSGGGVKCISYCGILEELEHNNILYNDKQELKIKGIAGTSGGSIIATLLAIGYTPSEIKEIIMNLDFEQLVDFKENKFIYDYINNTAKLDVTQTLDAIKLLLFTKLLSHPGTTTYNKLETFSLFSDNNIYDYIKSIIKQKTNTDDYTFQDLYLEKGINLVITATNLNTKNVEYFDKGSSMLIVDAIRMSMCLPLFFQPINYNDILYLDGGLLNNYPINVFEKKLHKKSVLGFNIVSDTSLIKNILMFFGFNNDTYHNHEEFYKMISDKYDNEHTIELSFNGYAPTQLSVSDTMKEELIKIGKDRCNDYFKKLK